jgi:hypothetical protein
VIRRASFSVLLSAVVLAQPIAAFVPEPEPVARAAAKVNRSARRAQALEIPVSVVGPASDEPLAHGVLLTSPDAQSRLEVRHVRGFAERQLRRSSGISATRDGQTVSNPRQLLPPMWVLQASSGARLLARLGELGGNPGVVELGYDLGHDCYVLGGRRGPSIWVDQDTLAVVRIDLAGGVTYRIGPSQGDEKGIQLPAWIETEAPGSAPVRLRLGPGTAATPAADAFRPRWLTASE